MGAVVFAAAVVLAAAAVRATPHSEAPLVGRRWVDCCLAAWPVVGCAWVATLGMRVDCSEDFRAGVGSAGAEPAGLGTCLAAESCVRACCSARPWGRHTKGVSGRTLRT